MHVTAKNQSLTKTDPFKKAAAQLTELFEPSRKKHVERFEFRRLRQHEGEPWSDSQLGSD